MAPQTRTDSLVVREMADELLVYDTRTHRAHCLNRTAALVFGLADGRRSIGEIAGVLESRTGTAVDEGLVRAALESLDEAGLLESGAAVAPKEPRHSRREVLRQVGWGAALLAPVVLSLSVPAPAEAAATCINNALCNGSNEGQRCYVSNPNTECDIKQCTNVAGQCL